jgi:hypothetical protein
MMMKKERLEIEQLHVLVVVVVVEGVVMLAPVVKLIQLKVMLVQVLVSLDSHSCLE